MPQIQVKNALFFGEIKATLSLLKPALLYSLGVRFGVRKPAYILKLRVSRARVSMTCT